MNGGGPHKRINCTIPGFCPAARDWNQSYSDICDVTRNAITSLAQRASDRGVELVTELPSEPVVFRFDPDLYGLALTNVVQNAIDASNAGQP